MFVKAQEITAPQIFYKNHSIALTLGSWPRTHKSIYLPDILHQSSQCSVELQTKVPEDYTKFYSHGEGWVG